MKVRGILSVACVTGIVQPTYAGGLFVPGSGAISTSRAGAAVASVDDGEALGIALVRAGVPPPLRKKLLGDLVSEDLADALDRHYMLDAAGDYKGAVAAEKAVDDAIAASARRA